MSLDFRRLIATDETIGAGNFFERISNYSTGGESPLLQCDEDLVIGEANLGRSFTATALRGLVEQLAAWFWVRGIRPRLPVGVFLGDSPLYYIYYLALTHIGAIPVQLNSGMSGTAAAEYLRKVGCFALVADFERVGRLRSGQLIGQGVKILTTEQISFPSRWSPCPAFIHGNNDTVLIAHTSGTTGTPKPVQFGHSGYFFGVRQQLFHSLGGKVCSALPHSHGSALTMFMSTVTRGVPLLAQTRKDPISFLNSIDSWKPALVMAFPKPLVDICRTTLEDWDLSSVSCWMSTGDASHERHIRRLIGRGSRLRAGVRHSGSTYIDNLGSSEFAFGILRNVHSPETDRYDRCLGTPFEWVDVEIFGEDDAPVGANTIGRLGVKSQSVTSGYWNDRPSTEANILHSYWLTGDLVFRSEDGCYYHVDRTTDRARVGNRMFYSCQTEELIMKCVPEVFDCTVVGVEAAGGLGVAIAVEPAAEWYDRSALEQKIKTLLAENGFAESCLVEFVEPGWNEGLTGKKLKRLVRAGVVSSAVRSVN